MLKRFAIIISPNTRQSAIRTFSNATNIYGQPIYFVNSSLRNVDFRGAKVIIYAKNCDFTGIKYDNDTLFAYDSFTVSEFTNCLFDAKTKERLATQGVRFTDKL